MTSAFPSMPLRLSLHRWSAPTAVVNEEHSGHDMSYRTRIFECIGSVQKEHCVFVEFAVLRVANGACVGLGAVSTVKHELVEEFMWPWSRAVCVWKENIGIFDGGVRRGHGGFYGFVEGDVLSFLFDGPKGHLYLFRNDTLVLHWLLRSALSGEPLCFFSTLYGERDVIRVQPPRKCPWVAAKWTPQDHALFHSPQFRREVRLMLLVNHRLRILPKDVLFIVIDKLAAVHS